MITHRRRIVTAACGALVLGAAARPAVAREEKSFQFLTPIPFGVERSPDYDIIYLRNRDKLRGTILDDSVNIRTEYGPVSIPVRRCAGTSFWRSSHQKMDMIMTVDANVLTGLITDRVICFRVDASGEEIAVRREKIHSVLPRVDAAEADFLDDMDCADLFAMANNNELRGTLAEEGMSLITDAGRVYLAFDEIETVTMRGDREVTAIVDMKNSDTLRGTVETEEFTLHLDCGVRIEAVHKDMFSRMCIARWPEDRRSSAESAAPKTGESEDGTQANPTGTAFTNSVGMAFAVIPAGSYIMGRTPGERLYYKQMPRHEVHIREFALGVTEVTQAQWYAVMGTTLQELGRTARVYSLPNGGDSYPMHLVSWEDANQFCHRLTTLEQANGALRSGQRYRLPSEAEWEYACRAGTTGPYGGTGQLDEMGWFMDNRERGPRLVGTKQPNAFGLYDMHGNVSEWCADDWHESYTGAPSDGSAWMALGRDARRVHRGGACWDPAMSCKSAARRYGVRGSRRLYHGFRVALDW